MSPLHKKENFTQCLALPSGPEVLFDMIYIEGGTFSMGSDQSDPEASYLEQPAHEVTTLDFYLGQYPVTQVVWRAVALMAPEFKLEESPSFFVGDLRPVERVSWDDITRKFLPALCHLTGRDFRLPTEEEWEYAAQGGKYYAKGYKYSGSDKLKEVGWFKDNSHGESKPGGLKKPNLLNLYDMSGNVWEWIEGYWHPPNNSSARVERKEGPSRLLRGGSFHNISKMARLTYLNAHPPSRHYERFGLRLAASF